MSIKKTKSRLSYINNFWEKNTWTGYNLSGLESGNHSVQGIPGINYPKKIDRKYAKWLSENNINCVRLPFLMERLIPVPGFLIELDYAKIIQDFCKECHNFGVKVMLDWHGYGHFVFSSAGGFTSQLDNSLPGFFNIADDRFYNSNNSLEIRNPTNITANSCYETVVFGYSLMPVSTVGGYRFNTNVTIVNTGNPIDPNFAYEGLRIIVFYENDNNYYFLKLEHQNVVTTLYKVVNNVTTAIGTANFQPALGTSYDISIDVNQTSIGNIQIYIDNILEITAPVDPALTKGKVGYKTEGSIANVNFYQVDQQGDTTSAMTSIGLAKMGTNIGTNYYNIEIHEYFWSKIVELFDDLPAIVGYMYNEPQGLPTPSTPANYKTTATITVFQQAALNKIRELGSDKWFGWTSDEWGGIQGIVGGGTTSASRWGANFDLPFFDPMDRTFLDLHYYMDSYAISTYNHSGTHGSIDGQTPIPFSKAAIDSDLLPVFERLEAINNARIANNQDPVPFNLSETGVPIQSQWLEVLDHVLMRLKQYKFGFFYFGIGNFFGNNLNNIACDPNVVQNFNGVEQISLTNYEERHKIIDKYLN